MTRTNSTKLKSILIIEDDPTLLRGLRDNFLARGFVVGEATDGRRGFEMACDSPPDLVLLDIMLPKMNGFEVCRAMREQGLEMPIIMLTAKGQEDDIVRGLELGADDYVTKPFSVRELTARSQAFLRRRQKTASTLYQFGNCELDCQAHRLRVDGRPVSLTTKEYQLLELFLRMPGRALTRTEIMNRVWGRSVIVTSRSVDRCVTTLRAKIEPDASRPTYIQTIRDIGYRFEPGDE